MPELNIATPAIDRDPDPEVCKCYKCDNVLFYVVHGSEYYDFICTVCGAATRIQMLTNGDSGCPSQSNIALN